MSIGCSPLPFAVDRGSTTSLFLLAGEGLQPVRPRLAASLRRRSGLRQARPRWVDRAGQPPALRTEGFVHQLGLACRSTVRTVARYTFTTHIEAPVEVVFDLWKNLDRMHE